MVFPMPLTVRVPPGPSTVLWSSLGFCRGVHPAHGTFSCYVIATMFSNIPAMVWFPMVMTPRQPNLLKAPAVDGAAAPRLARPARGPPCRAVAASPDVLANTQQGQCCQCWQTPPLSADITAASRSAERSQDSVSLPARGLRQRSS